MKNKPEDFAEERIQHLLAELKKKDEQITAMKTVMVAAAEEIKEHWQAHCDADGYGPTGLLHRLEQGLGSLYKGYTAGAFLVLETQYKALLEIVKHRQNEQAQQSRKAGLETH